ncbi:ATP synthase F1 subunit delta [Planctomicrobium sp. SH661]|uniref:ATP synthase F1 subunit delta n=1 Tax=Planctomicrobium sp. SH661 TaxID=3448124 RepID=UPI003F5C2186
MADASTSRPSHVLEDPSAQAVARVYALAYLDAALAAGEANPLEELTSFQDDVLNRNPEFAGLLTSELANTEEKLGLIERTIQPVASPFFTNFLKVLAQHGRLNLFPLVLSLAWQEQERRNGQQRVTVKSAVPLSEQQLSSIKNRLQSALNSEPILIPSVDENLIGGLVIQVGDTVYDGSLKSRLGSLRERLRKGYLHEIQSGRDRFSYPEGN